MKAEDLITLAAARGIDLSHLAGNTSKTGSSRRARREERHAHDCPTREGGRCNCAAKDWRGLSAKGTEDRAAERATWTVEELGQAAAGVPPICFAAACYSFAGDRSSYWTLWDALAQEATRLRRHFGWPAQVRDVNGHPRFYLHELAALVLDEDAHQPLFRAAPALYSAYLHVPEPTWTKPIARRFYLVQRRYQVWRETALSMIQSRLNEEDEETPESGRKIDEPEKAA